MHPSLVAFVLGQNLNSTPQFETPSSAAATATSTSSSSSSSISPKWTQAQVRAALNNRYILVRQMEQSGFRRIVLACGLLVGE